jgi:hypothetical protein
MQTALRALTAHISEAVRRNSGAYLPSGPLMGFGHAGELAAQHPAFAPAPEGSYPAPDGRRRPRYAGVDPRHAGLFGPREQ